MNIAKIVIEKLGARVAAELAGVSLVSVYRWAAPKERGGAGGLIPSTHQRTILVGARARGVDLRPEHFFDLSEFAQCPGGLPPLGAVAPGGDQPCEPGTTGARGAANDNQPAAPISKPANDNRPSDNRAGDKSGTGEARGVNDDHGSSLPAEPSQSHAPDGGRDAQERCAGARREETGGA